MSEIVFTLNGAPVRLDVDPTRTLLGVLRDERGLTGAKNGCGAGQCGACTVVVDDEAVRACQTPVGAVRGRSVVTIEGLANDEVLHPLQERFIEYGAIQCGFCTSGMIMNAYALLRRKPRPTRAEIIAAMDDNLCRCAGYQRILRAIEAVAGQS